jgi:hypothetical protein
MAQGPFHNIESNQLLGLTLITVAGRGSLRTYRRFSYKPKLAVLVNSFPRPDLLSGDGPGVKSRKRKTTGVGN